MRRLENEDEDKFWEAWIKNDLIFCYRFGKTGSSGHTKIKKFKTTEDAEAALEAALAEKLEEGFVEVGDEAGDADETDDAAEGADESEGSEDEEATGDDADEENGEDEDDDGGDEESEGDDDAPEAEAAEDTDDEESSDDDDGAEDDGSGDDADDEASDEDEDDGDGDDEESEDDEDEESEEEAVPEVAAAAEPAKPTLPRRFSARQPVAKDFEGAKRALGALTEAVGGRSWKLARRANLARRALERLAGKSDKSVDSALAAALDLVIASKKRLPLEHALGLLAEVDAGVFVKTARAWRSKMLSTPAAPAIGAIATIADEIKDPELALATALALADRKLTSEAWQRRFSHVRPVLAEEAIDLGALAKKLRADGDALLSARVKELAG